MPASSTMLASRRCHTPLSLSLTVLHSLYHYNPLHLPSFSPLILTHYIYFSFTRTHLLNHLFLALTLSRALFVSQMLSATFTQTHTSCFSLSLTQRYLAFSFCLTRTHSCCCCYPVFMKRMFLELHRVLSFLIGHTHSVTSLHLVRVHMPTFWICWPQLCSISITLNSQDQALSQDVSQHSRDINRLMF